MLKSGSLMLCLLVTLVGSFSEARRHKYIAHTPRARAKKYIYQVETCQVRRASARNTQDSQAGVGTIKLKMKTSAMQKRSIASE